MKQTAVEWLYEKLEYVNWMRNRDEISSGMANEWRKHYLEQAKAIEKEQIKDAFVECWKANVPDGIECKLDAEQYYNETFKSK